MKVHEFEEAVWRVEGIRIVVRADPDEEVGIYHYKKAAPFNRTIQWWLSRRVNTRVSPRGAVVIDGNGKHSSGPHLLGNGVE